MTSVFVGAQEITLRIKAHHTEDSLKPECLYKSSKTHHVWKDLLKRWKITNSGREQSGFTRKLGENVSDTEVEITGDVQWRVYFDTWICGAAPHSPCVPPQAVRHWKLCYLNAPGAAARIPTMNSAICPEVLRPPKLLFLYREGTCLLSSLTESHVQTATAEKKGLNNGIWDCKGSSEQGLTTTLSQCSVLSSWLAFRQLCKIYSPRKV